MSDFKAIWQHQSWARRWYQAAVLMLTLTAIGTYLWRLI